MVRRASTEKFERIEHIRDRITLHQGDLLDQRSLVDALRAAAPDRDLQPRRDVVRGRLLDPADAHGRVHRRRRHADARGDARSVPRGALLPGLLERDVRQGARGPADRDDALLPALALRRGEGLRALHHRQLPRVLRPARHVGDPVQPRVRVRATRRCSSATTATSPSEHPRDLVPLLRKGRSVQNFLPKTFLEIWDGETWTPITAITATRRRRTDPDHDLLRVEARAGAVEVTAHHNMLDADFDRVAARNVEPGDDARPRARRCRRPGDWTVVTHGDGGVPRDDRRRRLRVAATTATIRFTNNDAVMRGRACLAVVADSSSATSREWTGTSGLDPDATVGRGRASPAAPRSFPGCASSSTRATASSKCRRSCSTPARGPAGVPRRLLRR